MTNGDSNAVVDPHGAGHARVVGRKAPRSLYDMRMVTFEADQGAYNQRDAEGFIKLNALRLRLGARSRAR